MSGVLESLSEAVRSLWQRLAGSPAKAADQRHLRSLEELRRLILDLLTSDPITYLGYRPTEIRPIGPGLSLGQIPINFHGILIARDGEAWVEHVDRLLLHLGPAYNMESLKALLRDRTALDPDLRCASGLPWSDISGLLLPTLRGEETAHALNATWGDLFVTPVADLPGSLMLLTPHQLREWSITPDELLSAAMANLTERYGEVRATPADPAETNGLRIWAVTVVPHLNASLVLIPEVVASLPLPMDQLYVAVPDRGVLLFIEKPASPGQRQALLEAVFGMWWESAHRLSPYLHIWWDGALVRASAEEILGPAAAAASRGAIHLTPPGEQAAQVLTLPVGRGY